MCVTRPSFPGTAVTNCYNPCGLKQQQCIPSGSWRPKSQVQVWAEPRSRPRPRARPFLPPPASAGLGALTAPAKTPFPGRGGSAAPVAAWRTLPEPTRTLGGRVQGEPSGRGGPTLSAARRHVLSPAPPGEAALPFHAPFTGGKAEMSVSLGRGLQATRWPAQGWNPGGHETVAPSRARRNCPDGGRVPHSAGCRSEPPLPSHRDKPELCFRDTLMTPERPERNMGTRWNQRWRPRVALRRARPATHPRGRSLASLRRAGLFSPHASTPQPGGQTDAGQCWSSQVSRAGVSCALRAPGVGP